MSEMVPFLSSSKSSMRAAISESGTLKSRPPSCFSAAPKSVGVSSTSSASSENSTSSSPPSERAALRKSLKICGTVMPRSFALIMTASIFFLGGASSATPCTSSFDISLSMSLMPPPIAIFCIAIERRLPREASAACCLLASSAAAF